MGDYIDGMSLEDRLVSLFQELVALMPAGSAVHYRKGTLKGGHMRNLSLLTAGLALVALLVLATPIVRAQDIVKVAPKNCTVLLENDRVRVARVVAKPGEKIEMHSHPANISYGLTSGKQKFTSPDGKTKESELKAGQAVWSDAVTHSSENVGTTETRVLVIELKK